LRRDLYVNNIELRQPDHASMIDACEPRLFIAVTVCVGGLQNVNLSALVAVGGQRSLVRNQDVSVQMTLERGGRNSCDRNSTRFRLENVVFFGHGVKDHCPVAATEMRRLDMYLA